MKILAIQSSPTWDWQETTDLPIHTGITTLWIDLATAFSGGSLVDPGEVHQINVYLNAGTYVFDFIRLENLPYVTFPTEWVLYDFETGDGGWSGAGTVVVTTTHATHGVQALQVNSTGGWFSVAPASLDITGKVYLKFDIYSSANSSVKIALQTGAGWDWQETSDLWIPPGLSTVWIDLTNAFGGSSLLDPSDVKSIQIYFNAGTYFIDLVRVE